MEKTQLTQLDKQSQEFIFIDKEKDCKDCDKQKEITLNLGMNSNEEWIKVIELLKKQTLSSAETEYIYNFYNRVFKTNKRPGCGKCMRNIAIHLKNRWAEMNK